MSIKMINHGTNFIGLHTHKSLIIVAQSERLTFHEPNLGVKMSGFSGMDYGEKYENKKGDV